MRFSKTITALVIGLLFCIGSIVFIKQSIDSRIQNQFPVGAKYQVGGICMTVSAHRPLAEEVELIYIHVGAVRTISVRYELLTKRCE